MEKMSRVTLIEHRITQRLRCFEVDESVRRVITPNVGQYSSVVVLLINDLQFGIDFVHGVTELPLPPIMDRQVLTTLCTMRLSSSACCCW
jgi:hypothetical protein